MSDCMHFPDTVEEFMEQYKMTDTEQVYSNGTEYVPIFRMKQWFEHEKAQLSCEGTTKATTSDTISRQAAIDGKITVVISGQAIEAIPVSYIKKLPSAQPKRTEKRMETHGVCLDAISRQQAIDALDCINGTEEVLRSLPPAQPEPQWIPCSERMPEEHEWLGTKKFGTTISDEVYVTFENEKGERFCKHMTFQNGELSRYDKAYIEAWYKDSKPIAWMPLPKPFEGGIK